MRCSILTQYSTDQTCSIRQYITIKMSIAAIILNNWYAAARNEEKLKVARINLQDEYVSSSQVLVNYNI